MHGWPRELGIDVPSVSARNMIGSGEPARRLGWEEASVARERQVGIKALLNRATRSRCFPDGQNRQGVKKSMVRLSLVADFTQVVSCH
jgi:hypothetical protein